MRYESVRSLSSRRRLPCLLSYALAALALTQGTGRADPFVVEAAVSRTQFAERTDSTGVSRSVPSTYVEHTTYQESTASSNGGDFGGGYIRADDLATNTGFRVAFSALSLSDANVPGQTATLHSEAVGIASNAGYPIGFPVSTLDYGVWAGIHGYMDAPPAPGAPGGFVSLSLTSGTESLFADSDFQLWSVYSAPVQIACDFTTGPGTFVQASEFASFQYLNAEHTEFVAFGLSRQQAMPMNGIVAIEQHMILDLAVGPGTHVEMLAPPSGNVLPAFGGGLGWPQSAPVPEPGSLALLGVAPFGVLLARVRRNRH